MKGQATFHHRDAFLFATSGRVRFPFRELASRMIDCRAGQKQRSSAKRQSRKFKLTHYPEGAGFCGDVVWGMLSRMKRLCPICKRPVDSETDREFPFCSERCQLIDLGNWSSEKYKVSDPAMDESAPEEPSRDAEPDDT